MSENSIDRLDAGTSMMIDGLRKDHKSGYSWFFWIAALSLVNSVIILSGSDLSFIIGLGGTQIVDGIAIALIEEFGAENKMIISVIAFAIDAVFAGTFLMWGLFAKKGFRWAYITGMVLYALDGLIFVLVMDFLSIGFHIFALVCLIKGFKACGELIRIKNEITEGAFSVPATAPEATFP